MEDIKIVRFSGGEKEKRIIYQISSRIFEVTDIKGEEHRIVYSPDGYLTCSCPQFQIKADCLYTDFIRERFEKTGYKVKYRRPVQLNFIEDIKRFNRKLMEVLDYEPSK